MTDPFAAAATSAPASTSSAPAGLDDPFAKPSDIKTNDFPKFEDMVGELLVIQPTRTEQVPSMEDKAKMKTRITADVTIVDMANPAGSETVKDLYISNALTGKLGPLIETRGLLLGTPVRGKSKHTPAGYDTPEQIEEGLKKNPRMSFAWIMLDPTPEQHAAAMTWYRAKQGR